MKISKIALIICILLSTAGFLDNYEANAQNTKGGKSINNIGFTHKPVHNGKLTMKLKDTTTYQNSVL